MSLNEKLEEMRKASWGRWPADKLVIVTRARDDLARSGILDRVLKVGDRAPNFTLRAAGGVEVPLAGLLGKGPAVLVFYRGHW